jgi:ElaB/YqjD/DUF883 family membrane-anchored ribosome-binding protein
MENHTTAQTRDVLIKDVDTLKRDAIKITQDVKKHANAHVDETRQRFQDAFDQARDFVNDHPLALIGAGFFLGFVFGRRRS